jgi:acyl-CoA synthetase (NDP forming)
VSAEPRELRRLLRPRSVAFVGGEVARGAMAVSREAGFDGPTWYVHPSDPDAYRSVRELPAVPDAVFVAVNARATVDVVRELAELGTGGAACFAAGFSEAGTEEGVALEQALREAAGEMPVLGPNCYGVIDRVGGGSIWPVPYPHGRVERGTAVILQSGNLGINVTMSQRSLPIAFVASVGNQAVLEIAELVDAYLELDEVTAIGVYLEALQDVPRFAAAATRALERGVPIAVCKAGTSELGRELALTHTASLAGSDELYDALFARHGVARARSIPELLEMLKALSALGPLPGSRVFVFTCSGAESALCADAAAAVGVDLPQPAPKTRAALADALPEFALVGNPLDYNSALWGKEEPLRRVFSTALRDPVDAVLLVIDYPLPGVAYATDVDSAIAALRDATRGAGIPAAVASVLPESLPATAREAMLADGIAPLQGLGEAVAALAACARLGERLRAGRPAMLAPVGRPGSGMRVLLEHEAKALLSRAGVQVPNGRLVDPAEAPAAASALGFPVAVKLSSAGLAHKEAAGAVALGLDSEPAVAEAVAAMLARNAGVDLVGVLVECQISGGVCELLVGLRYDPSFGHVLVLGSGGRDVELIADARTLLLPAADDEVANALRRLRVTGRFERGDLAAAVDAVLRIATLADATDWQLRELDVNPLLVLEHGAVAVDALASVACL